MRWSIPWCSCGRPLLPRGKIQKRTGLQSSVCVTEYIFSVIHCRYRKPSIPGRRGLNGWLPYSIENNYLMIGNGKDVTVGMHFFFLSERMNFWKRINGTALKEESSLSYNSLYYSIQNLIVYVEYILSIIWNWIVSWFR